MALLHSSYYRPRIFPIKGDVETAEIDRAQSIDPSASLNREKVNEIGRDGAVGYLKKSPTVSYRLTQYEYGNLEFWQKLANTATLGEIGEAGIALSDFKTPYFDICAYLTDDDSTFMGTIVYPSLRTSGFSISIGDPQAIIERGFDFVGEAANIYKNDNKYYIYQKHTAGSAADDTITLDNTATVDPDVADKYMQRVVRVTSGGVTTELTKTTDYTENATTVTLVSIDTGDVIKLYYTSVTAPATMFTLNDADPAGILGDCASIYLYVPGSGKPAAGDYLYKLQSVSIDVSFDREDVREIGNKDVTARGIKSKTVTVSLGKMMGDWNIEEVLRGESSTFGKIDVSKFADNVALIIKVFSDNTKTTFKYGMLLTGLSPTETKVGATADEYTTGDTSLEGENLVISKDTSVIGI